MIYTLAGMMSADKVEDGNGEQKSPAALKIFWGGAIAVFGYVLLLAGGLNQVQRSVVMLGLPVLFILLINVWGFIKAVSHRENYEKTWEEENLKNKTD